MISTIDIISLIVFFSCWFGYSILTSLKEKDSASLFSIMYKHRLKWMTEALKREDKSVDVITLGNLMKSVSFFASTSILIIAGLIPLFGYGEKINNFAGKLPFVISSTSPMYEIKIILLINIFIYAFFKYTWALRQYNYASVLILASNKKQSNNEELAIRNAQILANAAKHFSMGVRGYYLGIAVLSWFLNPYLFIAVSILIMFVNYRREFLSKALDIIKL
ncbi:MAG: DUF599 domain-containing protein [Rickettsiales bacterium]|nr:DUF599 domain-containing protein [Rickettsiales bacterium]